MDGTDRSRESKHCVQFDGSGIPEEVKVLRCWVNWRYVMRKGKWTKVPLNPRTGYAASCNDATTWGSYEEAVEKLKRGEADGIGFQLGPPYVGIDLDKCRNAETGAIEPWAQDIIRAIDSYSETSPSKSGVHILAKGQLPSGARRKGQIEIYGDGRYFTVTGQHIDGTPSTIEERTQELKDLHARFFGERRVKSNSKNSAGSAHHPLTDAQLIEKARRSETGLKFDRLWRGDFSQYDSQSEGDLALCIMLAFWTGSDRARMDRLFRQSGLFRSKWDERHGADGRTYGQMTIAKAIEQTSRVWTPRGASESAGTDAAGEKHLPCIVVNNRQLRDVTDAAVEALQEANNPPSLFVRTGHVVWIRTDEDCRTTIEVATEFQLRARLVEISDIFRINKGGEIQDRFPPREITQNILALGKWPFPALHSIVEVPILRPDGTILSRPGYDPATRLFYAPAPDLRVPEIPCLPTNSQVAEALHLIDEAFGEFPYVDEASKANALGTALTPMLRHTIKGTTPLALIDAPQAGTGKGLLAEVISLLGTGRAAAMMAAPLEDEEWRKHITAALVSGATVITIDNVEHHLKSASLAIALTAREWTDRILGLSKMITVPIRVTWMATGNNIRLGGDLCRRCYMIRLDAKTSRPWERTGFKHPELLQWVTEHRGELLKALLTLARGWYAAGKPLPTILVMGGFEEWSRPIGGVLQYAGVRGFLCNREEMYESADESIGQWELFLQALRKVFGDCTFTVRQLTEHVAGDPELRATVPDELSEALDKAGSFKKRLGHALARRVGTRYEDSGLRIERAGEEKRATRWRVVIG